MRESRPYGSVRGVAREGHPYRDMMKGRSEYDFQNFRRRFR